MRAMAYRLVRKALEIQRCTWKQGKGDHEKWFCPCGKHQTVMTQSRIVSPGVIRNVIQQMACLPEGWLQ